jgi:coenzyme PQQ synthesis protein D (PqqD)
MSPMVAGGQRPEVVRLREDLPWREVDGGVVVLDLESSSYFAVNETGTPLWAKLVDGATIDELTAALATAEEIETERARADVEAFVAELRRQAWLAP